jgi:hypothetical protein
MYSSYSCTTLALDGGDCLALRPGRALSPGKGPPVPTGQEAGWASEPVWIQRLEKKSLHLPGIKPRSPSRPVRSQTLYWLCYPRPPILSFNESSFRRPKLEMVVFWDVAPCSLVDVDRRFRGTYYLHSSLWSSYSLLWKHEISQRPKMFHAWKQTDWETDWQTHEWPKESTLSASLFCKLSLKKIRCDDIRSPCNGLRRE